MKKWFRFSYLGNQGITPQENRLIDLCGDCILDRFIYIEDDIKYTELAWQFITEAPGFLRKSSYDILNYEPDINDPRIISFLDIV